MSSMQACQQRVQELQVVVAGRRASRVGKAGDRLVGAVSGVSRRNSDGGNRSIAPGTTPSVLRVSTSPSTDTDELARTALRR